MMIGKKKFGMLSAAVVTALMLGTGTTSAADTFGSIDTFGYESGTQDNDSAVLSDDIIQAFCDAYDSSNGLDDMVLLTDDSGDATDTGTDTGSDTGTDTGADTGADTDTKTDTDTDTKTDTDTDTDTKTDTDSDSDSDTKTDSDSDKKSDSTSGTDTNKVTGAVAKGNTGYVTGGQVYDSLNERMNNLDGKINRVGAGAAALAALHPETFAPGDKWSFAVGYGHYENASAGALGAFYKPNEDTTLSLGGTIGNGTSMMNAGVSFKLGSRGAYAAAGGGVSQKDFEALKAENETQNEELRAQRRELEVQRQAINVLRSQMLQLLQGLKKRST